MRNIPGKRTSLIQSADFDDCQREVVIDVGVHSGQHELHCVDSLV